MTDTIAHLHREILVNPFCVTRRLAFADALEDASTQYECDKCSGTGGPEFGSPMCLVCDGTGYMPDENGRQAAMIRYGCGRDDTFAFLGGHDATGHFPGTHECGERTTFYVKNGFINHVLFESSETFVLNALNLFRRHPITSVSISDRSPDIVNSNNPKLYRFYKSKEFGHCVRAGETGASNKAWFSESHFVPDFVKEMTLNHRDVSKEVVPHSHLIFSLTAVGAARLLSDGLVSGCRAIVGLPPLPPEDERTLVMPEPTP